MKYLFLLSLFTLSAYASLNDVDRQIIWGKNLLNNGGFESGKGSGVDKWTASAGTFNITITGAYLMDGKVSATWDAAASADTLSYGQITIPNGLLGRNGVLAAKIMVPSGTATHSLQVTDGTNVLGTVTITSSTTPTYSYVNFIYPSSGYVVPRLYANANEPNIVIDSVFLGDAETVNLTGISQATFIGSGYFATTTNCGGWSRTNATLGAFASDADCPGPTVEFNPGPGTIQTTDTNLPKFTVNNMPSGFYEIFVSVPTLKDATGNPCTFTLNDGTTSSGKGHCGSTASAADGVSFTAYFTYTTAGNHTFELYGASGSGAIAVPNDANNKTLTFSIKRYPLSSEQAFKPSTVPFLWEGRHDSSCSWTRNNTAYGDPTDTSCALADYVNINAGSVTTLLAGAGTVTPGFGMVFPRVSKYEVCASFRSGGDTTGAANAYQIVCGGVTIAQRSNNEPASGGLPMDVCGIYAPTSVSTASTSCALQIAASSGTAAIQANTTYHYTIRWVVKDIITSIPAPLLVNSVTSPYAGVSNICYGYVAYSGGVPSATRNSGSCLSSITDTATGRAKLNFATGTFSVAPSCFVTPIAATGGGSDACRIETDASTSSVDVLCYDGANADIDFHFICMGPK